MPATAALILFPWSWRVSRANACVNFVLKLVLLSVSLAESSCPGQNDFQCRTRNGVGPSCIATLKWQDGVLDCDDGSDEDCIEGQFECKFGRPRCISLHSVNDGSIDCVSGFDEGCPAHYFVCHDRSQCIEPKRYQDNRKDCKDGSDELCPSNQFACKTGSACVPKDVFQDGKADCDDGSDEECTVFQFECLCGWPRCIDMSFVQNGQKDCDDGSDETPSEIDSSAIELNSVLLGNVFFGVPRCVCAIGTVRSSDGEKCALPFLSDILPTLLEKAKSLSLHAVEDGDDDKNGHGTHDFLKSCNSTSSSCNAESEICTARDSDAQPSADARAFVCACRDGFARHHLTHECVEADAVSIPLNIDRFRSEPLMWAEEFNNDSPNKKVRDLSAFLKHGISMAQSASSAIYPFYLNSDVKQVLSPTQLQAVLKPPSAGQSEPTIKLISSPKDLSQFGKEQLTQDSEQAGIVFNVTVFVLQSCLQDKTVLMELLKSIRNSNQSIGGTELFLAESQPFPFDNDELQAKPCGVAGKVCDLAAGEVCQTNGICSCAFGEERKSDLTPCLEIVSVNYTLLIVVKQNEWPFRGVQSDFGSREFRDIAQRFQHGFHQLIAQSTVYPYYVTNKLNSVATIDGDESHGADVNFFLSTLKRGKENLLTSIGTEEKILAANFTVFIRPATITRELVWIEILKRLQNANYSLGTTGIKAARSQLSLVDIPQSVVLCGSNICDEALGEACLHDGSCGCLPGLTRRDRLSPCAETVAFVLPLRVLYRGDVIMRWSDAMANPTSDVFVELADLAELGLHQAIRNTAYYHNYITNKVTQILDCTKFNASWTDGVLFNISVYMRPQTEIDHQQLLRQVLESIRTSDVGDKEKGFAVGGTELYVNPNEQPNALLFASWAQNCHADVRLTTGPAKEIETSVRTREPTTLHVSPITESTPPSTTSSTTTAAATPTSSTTIASSRPIEPTSSFATTGALVLRTIEEQKPQRTITETLPLSSSSTATSTTSTSTTTTTTEASTSTAPLTMTATTTTTPTPTSPTTSETSTTTTTKATTTATTSTSPTTSETSTTTTTEAATTTTTPTATTSTAPSTTTSTTSTPTTTQLPITFPLTTVLPALPSTLPVQPFTGRTIAVVTVTENSLTSNLQETRGELQWKSCAKNHECEESMGEVCSEFGYCTCVENSVRSLTNNRCIEATNFTYPLRVVQDTAKPLVWKPEFGDHQSLEYQRITDRFKQGIIEAKMSTKIENYFVAITINNILPSNAALRLERTNECVESDSAAAEGVVFNFTLFLKPTILSVFSFDEIFAQLLQSIRGNNGNVGRSGLSIAERQPSRLTFTDSVVHTRPLLIESVDQQILRWRPEYNQCSESHKTVETALSSEVFRLKEKLSPNIRIYYITTTLGGCTNPSVQREEWQSGVLCNCSLHLRPPAKEQEESRALVQKQNQTIEIWQEIITAMHENQIRKPKQDNVFVISEQQPEPTTNIFIFQPPVREATLAEAPETTTETPTTASQTTTTAQPTTTTTLPAPTTTSTEAPTTVTSTGTTTPTTTTPSLSSPTTVAKATTATTTAKTTEPDLSVEQQDDTLPPATSPATTAATTEAETAASHHRRPTTENQIVIKPQPTKRPTRIIGDCNPSLAKSCPGRHEKCALVGETFACTCEQNYVRNADNICSRLVNECEDPSLNDCHSSALCMDNPVSYECLCKPGFLDMSDVPQVLPGRKCIPLIDECKDPTLNNCHPDANCIDLPGGFTCACKPGFTEIASEATEAGKTFLPGRRCVREFNECLQQGENDCSVNATCIDTLLGFECSCKPGFVDLSGNDQNDRSKRGRICKRIINECLEPNLNDCDKQFADCVDTVDSFLCQCKANTVDEDATKPGRNCRPLTTAATTEQTFKATKTSTAKATTTAAAETFTSAKPTLPQTTVARTNPCDSSTTNDCDKAALCQNTANGAFTCICPSHGFLDVSLDVELKPGRRCQRVINECEDASLNDCSPNALCIDTVESFTCTCLVGFADEALQNAQLRPGRKCTAPVAQLDASQTPPVIAHCNVNDPMACDKTRAEVCRFIESAYQCSCPVGVSRLPNGACRVVDECAEPRLNECDVNADCVDTPESYKCHCRTGFVDLSASRSSRPGSVCKQKVDECADAGLSDCDHENAECIDTEESYRCVCKPEFVDISNEFNKLPGRKCFKAIDECSSSELNNCSVNAICSDAKVGYFCHCKQGFLDVSPNVTQYPGRICNPKPTTDIQVDAVVVSDCDPSLRKPCRKKGEVCLASPENPNRFVCSCPPDSQRFEDGTCKIFDACGNPSTNDCDALNAVCSNVFNSFSCQCKPGFVDRSSDPQQRPGRKCVELRNECAEPNLNDCHANAKCTDTVDGYLCSCKEGFIDVSSELQQLPGRQCVNASNECAHRTLNSCDEEANCVDLPQGYACQCEQGYIDVSHSANLPPGRVCTVETVCNQLKLDLIFLVDGSGSIGSFSFQHEVLRFITAFIDLFDIGLDKTLIGIIQYSDIIRHEFDLQDHLVKADVIKAASSITYLTGLTQTGAAIRDMLNVGFNKMMGSRADVPKIGIVITDGRSQDNVSVPSLEARAKGIKLFAIGVTDHVLESELLEVTGNKDHVFLVKNYTDLNTKLRSQIQKFACNDEMRAQTEQPTTTTTTVQPPSASFDAIATTAVTPRAFACEPNSSSGCDRTLNEICRVNAHDIAQCVCPHGFQRNVVTKVCGGQLCNPALQTTCPFPEVCNQTVYGNHRCVCPPDFSRKHDSGICVSNVEATTSTDTTSSTTTTTTTPTTTTTTTEVATDATTTQTSDTPPSVAALAETTNVSTKRKPTKTTTTTTTSTTSTTPATTFTTATTSTTAQPAATTATVAESIDEECDPSDSSTCNTKLGEVCLEDKDGERFCDCPPDQQRNPRNSLCGPPGVCDPDDEEDSCDLRRKEECLPNKKGDFHVCQCPKNAKRHAVTGVCVLNECQLGTADCDKNAKCVDTDDSFLCSCPQNFIDISPDRLRKPGRICLAELDECAEGTHNCSKNAFCTDTETAFVCTCKLGFIDKSPNPQFFKGTKCEPLINECLDSSANDCSVNADCFDTVESFVCKCKTGFVDREEFRNPGRVCIKIAEERNEFQPVLNGLCNSGNNDCDIKAECIPEGKGSFQCRCPEHLVDRSPNPVTRPGRLCVPVFAECDSPNFNDCDRQGAKCVVLQPNGFTCECNAGFVDISTDALNLPGRICKKLINECETGANDCDRTGGICIDTPESFNCRCKRGFLDASLDPINAPGRFCKRVRNECEDGAADCSTSADCIDTQDSYQCRCKEGFLDASVDPFNKPGRRCIRLINECQNTSLNSCSKDADCFDTPENYRCQCKEGFIDLSLDPFSLGRICKPKQVNECLSPRDNDCDPNGAICIDKEDGFTCECRPGFVDASANPSSRPGRICLQKPVQAVLVPQQRTEQTSITVECTVGDASGCRKDLNEVCRLTEQNQPKCVCPETFQRNSHTNACTVTNECAFAWLNDCSASADCIDELDGFRCQCKPGFRDKSADISARPGHVCVALVNECATPGLNDCDHPSRANCIDLDEGFRCECKPQHRDASPDVKNRPGRVCRLEINECADHNLNTCDPEHATCEDLPDGYSCKCREGFLDVSPNKAEPGRNCIAGKKNTLMGDMCRCDISCPGHRSSEDDPCNFHTIVVNECLTGAHDCDLNATCEDTIDSFRCACNAGFLDVSPNPSFPGRHCKQLINECRQNLADCDKNAICRDTEDSFTCACPEHFLDRSPNKLSRPGRVCHKLINECAEGLHDCSNHSVCRDLENGFTCACKEGFVDRSPNLPGRICQISDVCPSDNDCGQNSICETQGSGYACVCIPGFVDVSPNGSKPGRVCERKNHCLDTKLNNCSSHARCISLFDGYSCQCLLGFEDHSEDPTLPGRICLPAAKPKILELNECEKSSLNDCDLENAECIDLEHSYRCHCKPGTIDVSADPINQPGRVCKPDQCADKTRNSCDPTAKCINTANGYECQCAQGFLDISSEPGKTGRTCIPLINECLLGKTDCDKLAVCEDTAESYRCRCPNGTIDISPSAALPGRHCRQLIDECALGIHDCDRSAICRDTEDSFVCLCPEGYLDRSPSQLTKPGRACIKLVDECSDHTADCRVNATCRDLQIGFVCECATGFIDYSPSSSKPGRLCLPEDVCPPNANCGLNAFCVPQGAGRYVCKCNEGFTDQSPSDSPGRICQRTTIEPSAAPTTTTTLPRTTVQTNPCLNRKANDCHAKAFCKSLAESPNSYTCQCLPGYEDNSPDVANKPGRVCTAESAICADSSRNQCHKFATCTEVKNSNGQKYTCACRDGWFDRNANSNPGRECIEKRNECLDSALNSCHAEAICEDLDDGYSCRCPTGFEDHSKDPTNKPGRECVKLINECQNPQLHDCSRFARCEDQRVGYSCTCLPSFIDRNPALPGRECAPVLNECESSNLNDCDQHSACIDLPDGFTCACRDPYHDESLQKEKPGRICRLDECSNPAWNQCDANAVCQDTDEAYVCSCKQGFKDVSPDPNLPGRRCSKLIQQASLDATPKPKPQIVPSGIACGQNNFCNPALNEFCIGGSRCDCQADQRRASPTEPCEDVIPILLPLKVARRGGTPLYWSQNYAEPTNSRFVELGELFRFGVKSALQHSAPVGQEMIDTKVNDIINPKSINSSWASGLVFNFTTFVKPGSGVTPKSLWLELLKSIRTTNYSVGGTELFIDELQPNPFDVKLDSAPICGSSGIACNKNLQEVCVANRVCGCSDGQRRRTLTSPCIEVIGFVIPLRVMREYLKQLNWHPKYNNPKNAEYKRVVETFTNGVYDNINYVYGNTTLRPFYVNNEVLDVANPKSLNGSWDSGLLFNFTVFFSKNAIKTPEVVWTELFRSIQSTNYSVGGTDLFIDKFQYSPFGLCIKHDCHPKATCYEAGVRFVCECPIGFIDMDTTRPGHKCQEAEGNECADPSLNDCSPNATCIDQALGYFCECKSGFVDRSPSGVGEGRVCELDVCSAVSSSFCPLNTTCRAIDGIPECICASGFTDIRTSPSAHRLRTYGTIQCMSTVDTNECELGLTNCSIVANCTDLIYGYQCQCPADYRDGNPSLPGRLCAGASCGHCSGQGDCVADPESPEMIKCKCHQWFTGKQCDTDIRVLLAILFAILFFLLALCCLLYFCCRCRCIRGRELWYREPLFTYRKGIWPWSTLERNSSSSDSGAEFSAVSTSNAGGKGSSDYYPDMAIPRAKLAKRSAMQMDAEPRLMLQEYLESSDIADVRIPRAKVARGENIVGAEQLGSSTIVFSDVHQPLPLVATTRKVTKRSDWSTMESEEGSDRSSAASSTSASSSDSSASGYVEEIEKRVVTDTTRTEYNKIVSMDGQKDATATFHVYPPMAGTVVEEIRRKQKIHSSSSNKQHQDALEESFDCRGLASNSFREQSRDSENMYESAATKETMHDERTHGQSSAAFSVGATSAIGSDNVDRNGLDWTTFADTHSQPRAMSEYTERDLNDILEEQVRSSSASDASSLTTLEEHECDKKVLVKKSHDFLPAPFGRGGTETFRTETSTRTVTNQAKPSEARAN